MDKLKEYFNWFSMMFMTVGGILASMLGGFDTLAQTLIILMVIDFMLGTLIAKHNKVLSSKVGSKGLIKKFCMLLLVFLAIQLDGVIQITGFNFRSSMILFIIANEGISIMEHMDSMGIKMPKWLDKILAQLMQQNDDLKLPDDWKPQEEEWQDKDIR